MFCQDVSHLNTDTILPYIIDILSSKSDPRLRLVEHLGHLDSRS